MSVQIIGRFLLPRKNKSTLMDRTSLEVTQYLVLLMQRLWIELVYRRINQKI